MTDLATRLDWLNTHTGTERGHPEGPCLACDSKAALAEMVKAIDSLTAERDDNAKAFKATLRIVTANVEKTGARLVAAERVLREIAEWSGPGDWTDLLKRMAREALPVAYQGKQNDVEVFAEEEGSYFVPAPLSEAEIDRNMKATDLNEPKHTRWSDLKAKRKAPDLNFSQPFPVDGVPKCVRQLVGPSGYIEAYCLLPKGHTGKHSPKPTDARSGKAVREAEMLREYASVIRQRPNLAFMAKDLGRASERLAAVERLVADMAPSYHATHAITDGRVISRAECQMDLCKRSADALFSQPAKED